MIGTFHDKEFPKASGGVAPYTYAFTCAGGSLPPGMGFAPATRRLAGTPTVRFHDSCTYTVTDSAQPAETVSRAVEVEVTGRPVRLSLLPSQGRQSLVVGTFLDRRVPGGVGRGSRRTPTPSPAPEGACRRGWASRPQPAGSRARRRSASTTRARTPSPTAHSPPRPSREPSRSRSRAGLFASRCCRLRAGRASWSGPSSTKSFPEASGGVAPYTYAFTCAGGSLPPGMGLRAPQPAGFAGTPTGPPLPRLVHVHRHRQRTARRDRLASRRGRGHGWGRTVGTHAGIRNGTRR